jgi:hypothetical protein
LSFPCSRHVSPRTETVPTSSTKGAKARLVHGMVTCPDATALWVTRLRQGKSTMRGKTAGSQPPIRASFLSRSSFRGNSHRSRGGTNWKAQTDSALWEQPALTHTSHDPAPEVVTSTLLVSRYDSPKLRSYVYGALRVGNDWVTSDDFSHLAYISRQLGPAAQPARCTHEQHTPHAFPALLRTPVDH